MINEKIQQVNYRKFVHPVIGYEVVLDANDNIITDSVNAGTYNFYNSSANGIRTRSGGFKQANRDFDALDLKDVRTIKTPEGTIRTGRLPNGENVSVRSFGTDTRPTIEIGSRATGTKIRFNP